MLEKLLTTAWSSLSIKYHVYLLRLWHWWARVWVSSDLPTRGLKNHYVSLLGERWVTTPTLLSELITLSQESLQESYESGTWLIISTRPKSVKKRVAGQALWWKSLQASSKIRMPTKGWNEKANSAPQSSHAKQANKKEEHKKWLGNPQRWKTFFKKKKKGKAGARGWSWAVHRNGHFLWGHLQSGQDIPTCWASQDDVWVVLNLRCHMCRQSFSEYALAYCFCLLCPRCMARTSFDHMTSCNGTTSWYAL